MYSTDSTHDDERAVDAYGLQLHLPLGERLLNMGPRHFLGYRVRRLCVMRRELSEESQGRSVLRRSPPLWSHLTYQRW